ncbi:hypothetical protein B7486_54420 [cyanobacterium TDX16]|nr:hypothetical protein B7486_54420 [cyanobacterium TDX16]
MSEHEITQRILPLEQRLAAIELNLRQVMTHLQIPWIEPGPSGPDHGDARRLLQEGNEIAAIKEVRARTGLGLAEAQQVVQQLKAGL